MSEERLYDVAIIGGGPAGLTSGLYAARARLSTVILEKAAPGGQAATTDRVENYPGFPEGIEGPELAMKMEEQARKFGAEILLSEVEGLELQDGVKVLSTSEGPVRARAVIIASGANARKLGVRGEDRLRGRGVSYCATCDGAFFRGQELAVVGGGDSAVEEALFLTRYASKVTIIHRRDRLRAAGVLQERAFSHPKISLLWDTVVEEITGRESVERLKVKNAKNGHRDEVPVKGIFIFVGMTPVTAFLPEVIRLTEEGYVVADEALRTSVPGIFAAGDVRFKMLRQISTAVGDGALAAMMAERYLAHG